MFISLSCYSKTKTSIFFSYRRNHIEKFGSNVARRFIDDFCQYVEHTANEAKLRENNQVLDINGYISLRRGTIVGNLIFDLIEYGLGLNLPQYVHEDPVFSSAHDAGVDLLAFTNVRKYPFRGL